MYKKSKQRGINISILLLLLTMMSIGYAAFQAQVKVKGTTRITSIWDIRITNVTSGTATGSATNAITPTWTGLTANMEANLYQEGDAMESTFEVVQHLLNQPDIYRGMQLLDPEVEYLLPEQ